MFATVLVGYDGGREARDALALGRALAEWGGGRLVLATVLPVKDEAIGIEGYQSALKEDSDRLFAKVLPELAGLEVETRVAGNDPPAEGLCTIAARENVDVIALGSTHRGPFGRIYPGSVAERLLHFAPCAVAVAPRGFASRTDGEPRVLAAAYDGSPESNLALEAAVGLAKSAEATVRVLAVHEPFGPTTIGLAPMGAADVGAVTQREAMEDRLHEMVSELPASLRAQGLLLKGDAADELLEQTEFGVDLLVMGSRGHGPVGQVLLGGVSAKVIRNAPCPVLVVPRGAGARSASAGSETPA
jgi:nucleotide-binding universal stress UspA family protein